MADDKEMDSLVDAFAVAGPSGKKKEVTYADFEKMLNETPIFMSASPEGLGMEDNDVLQGLRSLVFEGEGDGELLYRQIRAVTKSMCRNCSKFQGSRKRAIPSEII